MRGAARVACVALAAWGLLAAIFAGPARAEAPQVRIGVLVGNNVGNRPARALRFAEQEVERLGDVLRRSGGFESLRVMRGAPREAVEAVLADANERLARARAGGRSTLFVFYYSGHGDNEALELGATRLSLRDLRRYLEHLPADVRVAFVDACQSGALTGVKGGRRAPGYEVRMSDPGSVRGMAIVTSSTADELSQESDELAGSYFSFNLMTGLKGAADASGDGQVTLAEVYDYAFRRTLANTAASLIGGQHPAFDYRMSGTGDVVLTRTSAQDARLQFPREAGVVYTVLSADRPTEEVVAEVTSSTDKDLYLALAGGEYRVVRRALARVSARIVALAPGTVVLLDAATMRPLLATADRGRRKGGEGGVDGLRDRPGWQGQWQGEVHVDDSARANRLGAQVSATSSVLDGTARVVAGLGLVYARHQSWGALRLRAELARFEGTGAAGGATYWRVSPNLDVTWSLLEGARHALLVGPTMGLAFARQFGGLTAMADGYSDSLGFDYGALALVTVRVLGDLWVTASGQGGAEVFRLNGARAHKPFGSVALGGALAF